MSCQGNRIVSLSAAWKRVPRVNGILIVGLSLVLLALAVTSLLPWTRSSRLERRLAEQRRFDAEASRARHVDKSSPVYDIARSLAEGRWKLVQCDGTPSMHVARCSGYRILLRREWPVSEESDGVTYTFVKRAHQDIVLFPSNQPVSPDLKKKIKWEKLEQRGPEWLERQGPVVPVYMGTSEDYHWFGRTTIPQQDDLRVTCELTGGDDRLALLVKCLERFKDKEKRRHALERLARLGEEAIPVLMREIEHNKYGARWYAIHALSRIPGKRTSDLLLSIYNNHDARRAVKSALTFDLYRPEAKRVYLDILSGHTDKSYFFRALEAALLFGWKEAIPLVEATLDEPHSPGAYARCYSAIRALKGDPVPEELGKASGVICRVHYWREEQRADPEDVEKARATILACPDSEAALMTALSLASAIWKGNHQEPNRIGVGLLKHLPREDVLPVLEHLARNVRDRQSRERSIEVLETVRASTGPDDLD